MGMPHVRAHGPAGAAPVSALRGAHSPQRTGTSVFSSPPIALERDTESFEPPSRGYWRGYRLSDCRPAHLPAKSAGRPRSVDPETHYSPLPAYRFSWHMGELHRSQRPAARLQRLVRLLAELDPHPAEGYTAWFAHVLTPDQAARLAKTLCRYRQGLYTEAKHADAAKGPPAGCMPVSAQAALNMLWRYCEETAA